MNYYEVAVRSARYHGSEALTYHSAQRLSVGALVQVPLQREQVSGVVTAAVGKPAFKTKEITAVYALPPLPPQLLRLSEWLGTYYPAPRGIITQAIIPARLNEKDVPPEGVLPKPDASSLPRITKQQQAVLERMDKPDTYLLHGRTGSGKTRLYVELALRSVAGGRSAIILTPEISLTSQLAQRFKQAFGERVIVLHSQLTPTERGQAWQRTLAATEPLIIIGPRSALFSPVPHLGLIVLDESHEPAYKQEQAPHYQAGRVASQLRQLHDAYLVLGSATPSVTDYYLAEQKGKPILELAELAITDTRLMINEQAPPVIPSAARESRKERAGSLRSGRDDAAETSVQIVDLKDRSLFPRAPHLSQPLTQAIEAALLRHEQTLLYLNRRGTARTVLCENCGWQALCPHCDLPLTYHGDVHDLRCHVCNFHMPIPAGCPVCGHVSILFRSVGTKAIVDEVQRLFPGARVARFDTDNTKAERFEQHYDAVHAGEVDILVGTQLLAKGLDLPRLSTLGVVLADTSLYMPDFSAQERTYQLLSQVLGRVGRGHVAGHAIIQSYQPEHPVLQAAINGDWQLFYQTELESRRLFRFPPFVYLLKLTVRRASSPAAEKAAHDFVRGLSSHKLRVEIDGPAPALHEKLQGKYQWQLVLKAKDRNQLLEVIQLLPKSGWSYDIDPIDLL